MMFLDVFAKSEFDSGTFHDKQHGINTANAKPVKQHETNPNLLVGDSRPYGVDFGTCTGPEERWIPGDG